MKFIIIILLLITLTCAASEIYSTRDAINITGKAFVKVPLIKTYTKTAEKKVYKIFEANFNLDKKQMAYILGITGSALKGEIDTKVFKNLRWKSNQGFTITPLINYTISGGQLNLSLTFNYKF